MNSAISIQYKQLLGAYPALFTVSERDEIRKLLKESNLNLKWSDKLSITAIVLGEIGLGKAAVLSILFRELVENKKLSVAEVEKKFNTQISTIISGMMRVNELYARNASLETENFRKLFLTFL